MNFKLKFLKYKKKYNKLIAGMEITPTEQINQNIADQIDKCEYDDITTAPIQKKKLNEEEYLLALHTLNEINQNEYDILFIHAGGKNSTHKLSELPIITESNGEFKILILIIDIFEPHLEEFFSDSIEIKNNVFIQNLNIGLGTNPECDLYEILNDIINNIINRKRLVVIVNSMLFITREKQTSHNYFEDSTNIIRSIIKPEFLINNQNLLLSYDIFNHIFDEQIFWSSFFRDYFSLLENLTNIKVDENKNYLLNFLEKYKKEDKKYSFRHTYFLAKEIPDKKNFYLEYLNYLIMDRIQYIES